MESFVRDYGLKHSTNDDAKPTARSPRSRDTVLKFCSVCVAKLTMGSAH